MENKLPKNWVKTDLDSLFSLAYGKGLSVKELLTDGEYNVYGANGIIGKYNAFNQEKSKIIISCRGAASGAIHQTIPKSFITSNSIVLDGYSDELLIPSYVKYFMTSADKSEVITGTAQPQITIQLLKNLSFCFPPLPEQQRIVAKLDELFGHLDSLKTRLENIPQILKNFRQAVLTQAVTGKLIGGVEFKTLDDFEIDIKTGPFGSALHKSDYIENGIPVINPSHIKNGMIIPDSKITINSNKAKELSRWILKKDDIILGRRGEMGRAAKYEDYKQSMICGTGSIVLKVSEKISPDFLTYYLRSPFCVNYLESNSVGTTMINLNQKILKSLPFPVLTIKEQEYSIEKVEYLFAKADEMETQYQNLKTKIDSLPQAILAKAFKGELVEQLPTDGDAKDLLEEIKTLRESLKKKTVKKKRKKM